MKSKAATVDAYLEELPEDRRAALSSLRALIRSIVPDASETMQYGMASFSQPPGTLLFALASQKAHMAVYVCDSSAVEKHRARLGELDCGKGCIRFKKLDDLRLDAVNDILQDAAKVAGKA